MVDVALVPLRADHVAPLASLLRATPEFTPEEVSVAVEILEGTVAGDDYLVLVAERGGAVAGYACWGATPMTDGAFDLYWIAVSPSEKRTGIGAMLVRAVLERLRASGGRLLRVETEGGPRYDGTRAFYERLGFAATSEVRDFYALGRSLVVFVKYV